MRVQLEKRGVLGAGQVKKGGSLPRHIPILNIYVSTPPGVLARLSDFGLPGFRQFSWPRDDWMVAGDPSLNTVVEELPGWSPWSAGGLPVDLPSLPLSHIVLDSSDDSVAV